MADPLTTIFNFLYTPETTRYVVDSFLGFISLFVSAMVGNLRGSQYLYRAGSIKAGAANWVMFTVFLTLYIPNYAENFTKLGYFSILIIMMWLLTIGCCMAAAMGQSWQGRRTFSKIALGGGFLVTTITTIIIFAVFSAMSFT